jgi:hypothetical protein
MPLLGDPDERDRHSTKTIALVPTESAVYLEARFSEVAAWRISEVE